MKKLKVVVADDIDVMRNIMSDKLKEDERIEVVGIAEDGLKEYEMIKALKPDLVITDNQMPNMNGLDVIKKIAEEELDKKPEFIMISGDTLNSRYRELNVKWIFNKPVDYDNILRFVVEEYLEMEKNVVSQESEECIICENTGNSKSKGGFLDKIKKLLS